MILFFRAALMGSVLANAQGGCQASSHQRARSTSKSDVSNLWQRPNRRQACPA